MKYSSKNRSALIKIQFIVDFASDLTAEIKNRVRVVPLTVHFGDLKYIDGVTIDHKAFYEKLAETDVHPSTSQASPAAFAKEFKSVKNQGKSAAVVTFPPFYLYAVNYYS
ncbi:MAG: DegV family protein [Clostridia bacterium]|nr:DegV family protein [Clostridia bacterium]